MTAVETGFLILCICHKDSRKQLFLKGIQYNTVAVRGFSIAQPSKHPNMFVRIYTISVMLLKLYFFISLTYGDEKVLFFGSFFGVNVDGEAHDVWSTEALIPAVDMALQHINSDNSILAGYTLKHTWRDSKV